MLPFLADATFSIDWTQIIMAIIALIGLQIPLWLNARRAAVAATEAKETAKETHLAVNHRMETFLKELADKNAEVLRVAISEARAQGVKQTEDTIKTVALTMKVDAPAAGPQEVKVVSSPLDPVIVAPAKDKKI